MNYFADIKKLSVVDFWGSSADGGPCPASIKFVISHLKRIWKLIPVSQ